MRKIFTLLVLLTMFVGGATAQVTTRATAGSPMTFSEFGALAGTGKHFGIVAVSDNSLTYPKWFSFSTAGYPEVLTTTQLFDLENDTIPGWYRIKRVSDGKYVSAEGGNFDANTWMKFKLVNRQAGDYASEFSSASLHISLDDASGNHYNANTTNLGFRGGTGGYSTYAAYGPFCLVTVNCLDENSNPLQAAETIIVKEGATINAPTIPGKAVQGTSSATINADQTITFNYASSSYDYTLVVNNAPEGTTMTIKGENVAIDATSYSNAEAVVDSDVAVTLPSGYEYLTTTVTVSGTTITINCEDTRWPVNFPKTQTFTRGDRHINSASFNDQTVDGLYVNQSTLCYQDLTATKTVTLAPNDSVKPSFNVTGGWQHGFVYIDLNNDGDFTDAGELVAKSATEGSPNLATGIAKFASPATAGTYRMRIKTDWASEDPGGNIGDAPHNISSNNHIISNGGMIVDLTLQIVGTTAEQDAAFEKVKSWLPLMQASMALVTDASNYISNAKQSGEGSYEALLDKDNATFFHSQWSGSMVNTPGHDLQVRLPEPVETLHLFYVTRVTGTGYPTSFRIDGSNNAADFTDAAGGGATWTDSVATLPGTGMPTTASASYWSDKITLPEGYQYLRFVPTIGNNGNKNWFCLAEFWLFPSNATIDAAITMMKNVNSVYDITTEMIAEINQIDEDLRNATAKVTYVVKDEGGATLFTSDSLTVSKGTTVTTLPNEFQRPAFYTYNTVNETVNENKTIEFTATLKNDAPVKFTADATSPYYYNMNIRGQYLVFDETNEDKVRLQATSEPFNPNAAWAFIGNPYAGFSVINQTNGASNLLTYTTVSMSRPTTHNIQFQTGAEAEAKTWMIDTNNSGIVLRMKENQNIYFHHENGNTKYLRTCSNTEWYAVHNDVGSTIILSTDVQALVNLYNRLENAPVGEGPNKYSATGVSIADTLADAATVINNEVSGQYYATYQALLNLQSAMKLNQPTAGFYRIKGLTSANDTITPNNKYLAAGNASNGKFNMSDATDASTIFYFDGAKLANYGTGKGSGMSASSWGWVTGIDNASDVVFHDGLTNGGYAIQSDAAYFYDNGSNSASADRGRDLTFNASTNARYTNWYLEPVTELPFAISAAGQATVCLPEAFTVPAGVTVRYATRAHDGLLTVEDASIAEVPANEPVILVGNEGSYSLALTTTAETIDGNVLTGTGIAGVAVDAATTAYILAKPAEEVVFALLNDEDRNIAGFKAYFILTGEGAAPAHLFFEDGMLTGISAVNAAANGAAIYDLQGRRVNTAAKGVYIVNGKKVLVK